MTYFTVIWVKDLSHAVWLYDMIERDNYTTGDSA